ncbi:MerR family transcriptional regulator [Massilia sp. TS11]|uniref:MerR family transcriptional regulator n=1 Tax=Massilia sp. TS11 TaxID=2908003 RepID=UPI001EDA408B|nr:MerR family transcriptional regulator [Massilia sp. TS11]MCG2585081.1 MerR family transcriptional regulator [Massilia sp. TS11]
MTERYTIGQLARASGLSRTSLLYYEAQGLLRPARRTAAGYREYGAAELARLQQIRAWRAAGLGLPTIASLLSGSAPRDAIDARLASIQQEMAALREQQAVLLRLRDGRRAGRRMDKAAWVGLLRAAGLDDAAMARWHALFERQAPGEHESFLRGLGLDAQEVTRIRSWARRLGV